WDRQIERYRNVVVGKLRIAALRRCDVAGSVVRILHAAYQARALHLATVHPQSSDHNRRNRNPGTAPRGRGVYQARPTEAVAQARSSLGSATCASPKAGRTNSADNPARIESPRGCRPFVFLATVRTEESR